MTDSEKAIVGDIYRRLIDTVIEAQNENKALKEECERVAVEFHKAKEKAEGLAIVLNNIVEHWQNGGTTMHWTTDLADARSAIAAFKGEG